MGSDYQVFISFKNSNDLTEEDTLDKEIAYKVYKYLTDRRLNVFFSPVTLKSLGRDSWSEEIDIALKQSKVFIAVGTQKEYMNAKWVKEERTKFFGIKLNDESRAIYGYIASPMTLKDLPDDMGKLEVFQDKRPKELIRLYTYIRNHLAHVKQGDLESRKVNNKNYFWIGILIVLGVLFYNLNLTDDNGERLEDKKKIISAKESLIEVLKEERLEDKKIIKEKEEERKKDKELISFLLTKLKDHPNYDEIVKESKEIEKSKGTKAVINYLRSIDLDDYQNKDSVEIIDNSVKSIEMKDNIQTKTTEILNERITTQNDPNIINMTDTDGKSYSIKVLGNDIKIEGMEGKVVFLEFFGLNCPVCKDLIPNLISLKEKHKEKFQVMAIEVQKHDVDLINAYKKAHNINFITLSSYDVGSMVSYVADKTEWSGILPFTIIINSKGEVQFTQVGVMSEEQMEKYIETYSK